MMELNEIKESLRDFYTRQVEHSIIPKKENLKEYILQKLTPYESDELDQKSLAILDEWYEKIAELGVLLPMLASKKLAECAFHHPSYIETIDIDNTKQHLDQALDTQDYLLLLKTLALKYKIDWNYTKSFQSFTGLIKNQKFRFSLLHQSNLTHSMPKLFIRKAKQTTLSLDSFTEDEQIIQKLKELVQTKKNIIIAGATGSGKTTLLNSLIAHTDMQEHIVTLEDTEELICPNLKHTAFISKDSEGKRLVDYCAQALRITPERIILGELRSNEVVPFLLSMNCGHKGLMSSVHANNAPDTVERVALLFQLYSINSQINYATTLKLLCKGLDAIVYIENKKVKEILKVIGVDRERVIFESITSRNT